MRTETMKIHHAILAGALVAFAQLDKLEMPAMAVTNIERVQ